MFGENSMIHYMVYGKQQMTKEQKCSLQIKKS